MSKIEEKNKKAYNKPYNNTNKKLKIVYLFFATLNYCGGAEKGTTEIGKWLTKKGHKVTYITGTEKINNKYHKIMRWAEHKSNMTNKELKKTYLINDYQKFNLIDMFLPTQKKKEIIKKLNAADVIVSKNEILELIPLLYLFKTTNKRIIIAFHTPVDYSKITSIMSKVHNIVYASKLYIHLLKDKRIEKLLFTAPSITKIEKRLINLSNNTKKTYIVPNSIDPNKYYEKEKKKGKKFKVYYVGRMTEQKGIDILAKAIELISKNKNFKEMEFKFIGNGNDEQKLKELNKYSNCNYIGFEKEVTKFYQKADLMLVPSRWEGFPYTILEAQSTGTPVITTNTPGCRDIITNKHNGWIFESEDYKTLSQLILNAHKIWKNDYKKFKQYGKNSRKRIMTKYSQDIINKRIEKLLLEKR